MKYFLNALLFFSILGCDETVDKYLYEEGDPEYSILQQMQAAECINSSKIFTTLENTSGDLASFLGKIYRITVGSDETIIYMYVSTADASSMTVKLSSDDTDLNKNIIFTSADHTSLLDEIKIMACNSAYEDHFSSSGLSSTSSMSLTWNKETIIDSDVDDETDDYEAYSRQTDKYVFNKEYPLFFYFFNGSRSFAKKASATSSETTGSTDIAIKEIDSGECDDILICNGIIITDTSDDEYITISQDCNVEITTGLYSSNAYDAQILKYSEAGCEALDPY